MDWVLNLTELSPFRLIWRTCYVCMVVIGAVNDIDEL